jgi:hypothetical protein
LENNQTASSRRGPVVLEAMKMEHAITAPADGTVAAVHFKVGEQVEEGVELLVFEGGRLGRVHVERVIGQGHYPAHVGSTPGRRHSAA